MRQVVKRLLCAVVLIVLALGISGCPGGSALDSGGNVPAGTFTETGQGKVGGAAAASAQKVFAANATPADGKNQDYKIAPLDVLEISVFGVKDLDRTVQVSSSGMISLPLIKSARAGGKTQAQLEREIATKLEANYLQSPQVSVFVKEYNSQRITVDGAVNKPGIFPTTGSVSLLQAIALAEGLNTVADTSGILLFRTVDNKRLAARYDLKQIRTGKVDDPMLQAGDIVMVDESSTRTTLRDVKDALPLTGLFQLLLL
jgi:polysaccharide biosynthesis/export protein